ncbi:MAG: hypothetical protein ABIP90_06025 [Vicinamibacterales bacterium]
MKLAIVSWAYFRYCMPCMARGWESKSVESQQDDRAADAAAKTRAPVSPQEAARRARRQTLELALARAAADLKHATHPAHRQMLEAAIAALTGQLQQDLP